MLVDHTHHARRCLYALASVGREHEVTWIHGPRGAELACVTWGLEVGEVVRDCVRTVRHTYEIFSQPERNILWVHASVSSVTVHFGERNLSHEMRTNCLQVHTTLDVGVIVKAVPNFYGL